MTTIAATPRSPSTGEITSVLDRVSAALHEQGVRGVDHRRILVLVLELVEEEPHRVDAGALLVVALDRGPLRVVGVRVLNHRFLGQGVVVPLSRDSMSMGESFHRRTGSIWRIAN